MAMTFPEILGDLTDARERYEADGVQFVARWESSVVPAGQAVTAVIYVQNTLDQPVQLTVTPTLGRTGMLGTGLLRGGSALKFETMFPQTYINLAPGEVGTWRIPLGVPAATPARSWDTTLSFRGQSERAQRVRPAKANRNLESIMAIVDDTVGLGITPVTGVSYESRDGRRIGLKLEVTQPVPPPEPPDLTPQWSPVWIQDDLTQQVAAFHEINNSRLHVIEELGSPVLFEMMRNSIQARLEGTSVQPHFGESLAMAKILTYTVGLFMRDEETQNALLVPAYMEAMRAGRSLSRPAEVLSWSGLGHVVRLAVAASFRIVANTIGRQPWSVEERRGVTQYVAQCIEQRQALPPEFLYLPLMLGALTTMPVRMGKEEQPIESFKMLGFAWQTRQARFKEDPELQDLIEIFNAMARGVVNQVMQSG